VVQTDKERQMTNLVIVYAMIVVLLTAIIFQQQQLLLTVASPREGTDNQTGESRIVIPDSSVNGNITEPQPEPEQAPVPEEPPADDVVHCAALGCPGNPPNPHGPPTEEPERDE
jgi:hypothetical protein